MDSIASRPLASFMAACEEARLQTGRGSLRPPDSGTDWEHPCDDALKKSGFINVGDGAWPSCYFHTELDRLLSVYVDDFKILGPMKNMSKGWQPIAASLELDPPQPLSFDLIPGLYP